MKYPEFKDANELIAFMNKHVLDIVEDMTSGNWAKDKYIEEIHEKEGPTNEYDETYGLSYEDRRGYSDHIVEYREDISDEEISNWIRSGDSRLAEETAEDVETIIEAIKANKEFANKVVQNKCTDEEDELIDKGKDPITITAINNGLNDNDSINFLYESLV